MFGMNCVRLDIRRIQQRHANAVPSPVGAQPALVKAGTISHAGKVQTQTAAEMMQTYAMIAQQHAQDVQKLSTAFDTLYASLTPEQKKSADDM